MRSIKWLATPTQPTVGLCHVMAPRLVLEAAADTAHTAVQCTADARKSVDAAELQPS